MLLIKSYVDKSKISGLGLFAKSFINKGQPIWVLNTNFDRVWDNVYEFYKTNPAEDIQKYAYERISYAKYADFQVVYCVDDARFINHSITPNIYNSGMFDYALTDILPGDEITIDYGTFVVSGTRPTQFNKEDYE